MTGFDFFVDLTVTGTVLGLDHTSDVVSVREVFAERYGGFPARVDVDDLRKAVAGPDPRGHGGAAVAH